MEDRTIIILDPRSKPKVTNMSINPRPSNIGCLRVAMVDNTKPNFSIFLDRIEAHLTSEYQASVKRFRKPGRTQPLDSQIIEEIKKNYDLAITGLGD
jgi:hypothetical protein